LKMPRTQLAICLLLLCVIGCLHVSESFLQASCAGAFARVGISTISRHGRSAMAVRKPMSHLCMLGEATDAPVSTANDEATVEKARSDFLAAALKGPKNGVDASPEQREQIESKLERLIELNTVKEPAYALLRPPYQYFDGTFELLYTNTAGGSSGKVGPFIGDVTQTFLGIRDNDAMGFSRRGVFTNNVQVGPLRVSLQARCESKTEEKLVITFEETSISLFGVPVKKKEFEIGAKGSKGSWSILYMDASLRVLKTNAGNYMVLKRGAPEGGESWMERQNRLGSEPL